MPQEPTSWPPPSPLRCRITTSIPSWGLPSVRRSTTRSPNSPTATTGGCYRWATCPCRTSNLAIGELRRITDDYGFKGIQVGSNIGGKNLGDESHFPFWEEVRERDLFVFSHGVNPLGADRLSEHQLHNFVGLPIDTAVSVGSMVFNGVYERLPGLKICYSHGGGAFPCLLGRWDHGFRDRLSAQSETTIKMPTDYLVDMYADSLTHDAASLRFLVERLGAGQVVLGSDHPFDMGEKDPVGKLKEAIDDPAVVSKIAGVTAARLLNIA